MRVLEQQVTKVDRKPHSFLWELGPDILINRELRAKADRVVAKIPSAEGPIKTW